MTTMYLEHETCRKSIKAVRRILPQLLSFDPTLSQEDYRAYLLDAQELDYNSNIQFLQDKLMYYYFQRDRELEEGEKPIYHQDNNEDECIEFALESLLDYIKMHTEDKIFSSIKIGNDYVSVALAVEVYD